MSFLVTRDEFQFNLDAANTPGTASVDAGSGANRVAVGFVYWRRSANHDFANTGGCTYNGVNAAPLFSVINGGTQYSMQAWILNGPATGTNTLSFNPNSGTGTQSGCIAGYAFYEDVDYAAIMADLAGYLATSFNNGLGAAATVSETVNSAASDRVLFVSAFRDGAAGSNRTATAGAIVGALSQTPFNTVYAMAQGEGAAVAGTSSPSMSWDNNAGTIERRFALTLVNAAAPAGPSAAAKRAYRATQLLMEP